MILRILPTHQTRVQCDSLKTRCCAKVYTMKCMNWLPPVQCAFSLLYLSDQRSCVNRPALEVLARFLVSTVNMGQSCLESMVLLCHRLHQSSEFSTDRHQRNIFLSAYARHVFTVPSFERSAGDASDTDDVTPISRGSHFATMTRLDVKYRACTGRCAVRDRSPHQL